MDFNFFKRVNVTSSTFSTSPDIRVQFTTTGVLFLNEGTGVVEFSLDGTNVHGSLNSADASKGIIYDNRVVDKLWLRRVSGDASITVRVECW